MIKVLSVATQNDGDRGAVTGQLTSQPAASSVSEVNCNHTENCSTALGKAQASVEVSAWSRSWKQSTITEP